MSDLNEDIEFRPLSEGLGFHQKKRQNQNHSSDLEEKELFESPLYTSASPSKNTKKTEDFKPISSVSSTQAEPLRSHQQEKQDQEALTPVWMKPAADRFNPWAGDLDIGREPTVDGIVENGMENATVIDNPFFVPKKVGSPVEVVTLRFSGHDGLKKGKLKPVLGSFTAIVMDVLTLMAICMIVLTMVLTAMGESVSTVLAELPHDATQRSYFLGMILTLSFMYLVLARCFVGRTLGEWMFHLQLGSNEDQLKASYAIKVLLRTIIVFMSGFVLFPLLSYLAGKDILVYFSGIEMHGEKLQPKKS